MNCQWKEKDSPPCGAKAGHELRDKNGKIWANLCDQHNNAYSDAIKSADAKRVLAVWVRASGGSKVLADSMRPDIQKGVAAIIKLHGAFKKPHAARAKGESTCDYIRRVVTGGS